MSSFEKGTCWTFRVVLAAAVVLGMAGLVQAAGPDPGGESSLAEGEMAIGPGGSAFVYYSEPILQVTGTCQGTDFSLQITDLPWPTEGRLGGPAPAEPETAKDLVGFTYFAPPACMIHAPHAATGEFIVSSVQDFYSDVPGSGAWYDHTFAANVQMLWVVENPSPF